jgi:hypothetical protein
MVKGAFPVTPLFIEEMESGHYSGMSAKGLVCKPRLDESTVDHLLVLLRQELEVYSPCKDYLTAILLNSSGAPSERVSAGWRRKLCEWCFEIVDHFGFDREVVSIALNYLDRAVALKTESSTDGTTKREFQLIAVTSLYIAIKLHGETGSVSGPRRKLRIDVFVELSRGFFQVEVIEAMERTIIKSLDWRLNPPTSLRFINNFLRLLPMWSINEHFTPHAAVAERIYDLARYLSELSVCVSGLSFDFKTSTIAYACILCTLEALQEIMPLPYDIRVKFLNDLAEVTGLFPETKQVRQARDMIKELCPSLFQTPHTFLRHASSASSLASESFHQGDGKASPVCIADATAYNSPATGRKRSRAIPETNPPLGY